jgi:hypothetical protein
MKNLVDWSSWTRSAVMVRSSVGTVLTAEKRYQDMEKEPWKSSRIQRLAKPMSTHVIYIQDT